MKFKIFDSLKPLLTKDLPREATGNWMRCQEVMSVLDKNINSWIFKVGEYEETMAKEQSQNWRGEYQIDEITYAKMGEGVTV